MSKDRINKLDITEFTEANFLKLKEHCDILIEHLNATITYTDYLSECLDKSIGYSEHISNKLQNVFDYLDLKNDSEFTEYLKMVEERRTDVEINAFFRKKKIKKLLEE